MKKVNLIAVLFMMISKSLFSQINCDVPINFTITNEGGYKVGFSWEHEGGESFTIEYGRPGFPVTIGKEVKEPVEIPSGEDVGRGIAGRVIVVTGKNIIIENENDLIPNSNYVVYITTNCDDGGFSEVLGPYEFKPLVNYCKGDRFFDGGGEFGDYSNSLNVEETISPESEGENVRVIFNSFLLENGFDFLEIYDGPNSLSNSLGKFTGADSPGTIVSSHVSGALTFVFVTNESHVLSGWDATVTCELKSVLNNREINPKEFNIFPIPNNGVFTINTVEEDVGSIKIFNVNGVSVQFEKNQSGQISITNPVSGIYFLKIETGKGVLVRKLIVN